VRRSFRLRIDSINPRRSFASSRCGRAAVAVTLLIALLYSILPSTGRAAPPPNGLTSEWRTAVTTHFRIHVQSGDPAAAASFAVVHGGTLETAFSELSLLFAVAPPADLLSVYVYSDPASFESAKQTIALPEIPGVQAHADIVARDISLLQAGFEKLSPQEAENQLRHAVSHLVTAIASNGSVPWGFDEGIAQYIERPVNEKLARIASLVQASNQRGELPSWFDMNRPNAFVDPALAAAQSYSVIAFLIDRFEIKPLRQFMADVDTAPSWNEAMRSAYGRDPNDLEKQWEEDLPRWTAGEWRDNLIAAFNLEPARKLLEGANYAAAKTALDPSQTLFRQLDAPEQLALVEQMIEQCDIGIQAESLMTQTQQALESHTYDRAVNLLSQAKLQFAKLPEEQRPTELLATYEQLATSGLSAMTQLDEAKQLRHSWRDFPEARGAAREAGIVFASLGDEAGVADAQRVLDELDKRQRRIVLLLAALAVLTLIWLGLWLWARGPSELSWT